MLVSRWTRDGRLLPGDIVITRPGLTFYLPLVTCLVLSILLTGLLTVLARFLRH